MCNHTFLMLILYILTKKIYNSKQYKQHTIYTHILQNMLMPNTQIMCLLMRFKKFPIFRKRYGVFLKDNFDVYCTGSNAYMLSGEISTMLSGRYIEIPVHSLSFV